MSLATLLDKSSHGLRQSTDPDLDDPSEKQKILREGDHSRMQNHHGLQDNSPCRSTSEPKEKKNERQRFAKFGSFNHDIQNWRESRHATWVSAQALEVLASFPLPVHEKTELCEESPFSFHNEPEIPEIGPFWRPRRTMQNKMRFLHTCINVNPFMLLCKIASLQFLNYVHCFLLPPAIHTP